MATRSATRTAAHFENDPAAVLRTVNDVLHVWFDGRISFVTAALASLRRGPSDTWHADLASAGHPPALVRRADGTAEFHGGGGLVLGIGTAPMVADAVVTGLADERFLILPHPEVLEYVRRKTADYDRWLRGMRKLQARFPDVSDVGRGPGRK